MTTTTPFELCDEIWWNEIIRLDYFCPSEEKRLQYLTNANKSEIFENNGIRRNTNYIYTHSLEGGIYPTIYLSKSRHLANVLQ